MPRQKTNISRKLVDDEVLLFDPETQQAHFLNLTAVLVWDLCDGHHTEEAIAREMASRYEVEWERALQDVRTVMAQLREKGLLEQGS